MGKYRRVAAFAALCIVFASSCSFQNKPGPQSGQNARAAVVDDFAGEVSAVLDDGAMQAFKGLALLLRNSIGTGAESWSSLELGEGRFALVEQNSEVQIAELAENTESAELFLKEGKIWVGIKNALGADENFTVNTSSCSMSARGTVFSVSVVGGRSRVAVFEGTVALLARDADGNPIPDKNGDEIAVEVTNGAAELSFSGGVASVAKGELTEEDLAPFRSDGPEGPGGLYKILRERLKALVWEAPEVTTGPRTEKQEYIFNRYGKNDVKGYAPEHGDPIISPGAAIEVFTMNITGQMEADGANVGIYRRGAAHGPCELDWKHASSDETAGTILLSAPGEAGGYEVRIYSTDKEYSDATFLQLVYFTVAEEE